MVEAETEDQLRALGFVDWGGGDWGADLRGPNGRHMFIWRPYPQHPDYGKYIADSDTGDMGDMWDDPRNPRFDDPIAAAVYLITEAAATR